MSSTEQAAPSRLSYTNSTSAQIVREKPSRGCRLTERDGVPLREDVRDWFATDGDRPVTWQRAKTRLIEYDQEARETANVFENTETGETASSPVSHRFQQEYREMWYAKFHDLLRRAREEWSVVHTTMLGLTGSSIPDGDRMGPVDHWRDVDASNDAVKQALRRVKDALGGAVVVEFIEAHPGGGTNDGYLHKHPVILSGRRVPDRLLQRVVDAHVRNSPVAEDDAHDVEQCVSRGRLEARKGPEQMTEEVVENLPAYLAGYLLDYDSGLEELPEPQLAGAAVMWAAGVQSVRPDQTAQEWMAPDDDEDDEESPWILLGVEKNGEIIEADSAAGGGVRRFTTTTDPPD